MTFTLQGARLPGRAAALALVTCAAVAQAQPTDPVDQALDACLASERAPSTARTVACTAAALDAWDARLNETYRRALDALDPRSRELLRTSQRHWLAFRKAERAVQAGPWLERHGSAARVQAMGAALSASKERVRELQLYLP